MVKFGWSLTAYLCLSAVLFLVASNTILGGIIYLFLIFPIYAAIGLGWWIVVWRNPQGTVRLNRWLWAIAIGLQILTIATSPGNCFGVKQGDRCYSNLQILLTNLERSGANQAEHWPLVEDAFPGVAIAHAVALAIAVSAMEKHSRSSH